MNYYLEVLKKYAVFSGRARRKEYWVFALFNIIIAFILGFLSAVTKNPISILFSLLYVLYFLAILIPGIAVYVRRLHDTNRSGWWLFISLIPIVGTITLLVFTVMDSTPGENRFGPNPKEIKIA